MSGWHKFFRPAFCLTGTAPERLGRIWFAAVLTCVVLSVVGFSGHFVIAASASPAQFSAFSMTEFLNRSHFSAVSAGRLQYSSGWFDESGLKPQLAIATSATFANHRDGFLAVNACASSLQTHFAVPIRNFCGATILLARGTRVELDERSDDVTAFAQHSRLSPCPMVIDRVDPLPQQLKIGKRIVELVSVFMVDHESFGDLSVVMLPNQSMLGKLLSIHRYNFVTSPVDVADMGNSLTEIVMLLPPFAVHPAEPSVGSSSRASWSFAKYSFLAQHSLTRRAGSAVGFNFQKGVWISVFSDSVVVSIAKAKLSSFSWTLWNFAWRGDKDRWFSQRVSVNSPAFPMQLAPSSAGVWPGAAVNVAVKLFSRWRL